MAIITIAIIVLTVASHLAFADEIDFARLPLTVDDALPMCFELTKGRIHLQPGSGKKMKPESCEKTCANPLDAGEAVASLTRGGNKLLDCIVGAIKRFPAFDDANPEMRTLRTDVATYVLYYGTQAVCAPKEFCGIDPSKDPAMKAYLNKLEAKVEEVRKRQWQAAADREKSEMISIDYESIEGLTGKNVKGCLTDAEKKALGPVEEGSTPSVDAKQEARKEVADSICKTPMSRNEVGRKLYDCLNKNVGNVALLEAFRVRAEANNQKFTRVFATELLATTNAKLPAQSESVTAFGGYHATILACEELKQPLSIATKKWMNTKIDMMNRALQKFTKSTDSISKKRIPFLPIDQSSFVHPTA